MAGKNDKPSESDSQQSQYRATKINGELVINVNKNQDKQANENANQKIQNMQMGQVEETDGQG